MQMDKLQKGAFSLNRGYNAVVLMFSKVHANLKLAVGILLKTVKFKRVVDAVTDQIVG